jgi:hypothetical protein
MFEPALSPARTKSTIWARQKSGHLKIATRESEAIQPKKSVVPGRKNLCRRPLIYKALEIPELFPAQLLGVQNQKCVADDAVLCEPVSILDFPVMRENNREKSAFVGHSPNWSASLARNFTHMGGLSLQTETGNRVGSNWEFGFGNRVNP